LLLVFFALSTAQTAQRTFCTDVVGTVDAVVVFFGTFSNRTDDARLPPSRNVELDAAVDAASFAERIRANFATETSLDLRVLAETEAAQRLESFLASYPVDVTLRISASACLETKRLAFQIAVTTLDEAVRSVLEATFQARRSFLANLRLLTETLLQRVASNDTLAIVRQNLLIEAANVNERDIEVRFFVQLAEQSFRRRGDDAANKTVELIRRIQANDTVTTIDEFRRAARNASRDFFVEEARWRQAKTFIEQLAAQAAERRAALQAAEERLISAIRETWETIRTRMEAWFNQELAKIRERIAAALQNIECDATGATATFTRNADGTIRVAYGGIVCYDATRTPDQLRDFACAALRAHLVSEVGTVDLRAYGCAAVVTKKRATQSTLAVIIDGSDPATLPPPPGSPPYVPGAPPYVPGSPPYAPPYQSSGVSITAYFLILLFSLLVHF
jgi:hypothetical protein